MCIVDDYDTPAFVTSKWQRTRKPRRCYDCRWIVPIGDRYWRTTGKWDGRIDTFARCEACVMLAQAIDDAECSWAYGSLLEDAEATIDSYEHTTDHPEAVWWVAWQLLMINARWCPPWAEAKS